MFKIGDFSRLTQTSIRMLLWEEPRNFIDGGPGAGGEVVGRKSKWEALLLRGESLSTTGLF